jgi:hypothetical protein
MILTFQTIDNNILNEFRNIEKLSYNESKELGEYIEKIYGSKEIYSYNIISKPGKLVSDFKWLEDLDCEKYVEQTIITLR